MIYYYVVFGILLVLSSGYLVYERFKKPNPKLEKIVSIFTIVYLF